jgi:hypothetical protein
MEGCKVLTHITIEALDGSRLLHNCYGSKCYQNFVRSDMPGFKIISAHIEVLYHLPIDTNWYETFSLMRWEIVVTATIVVVVVVCYCHNDFLLGLARRKPHGDI